MNYSVEGMGQGGKRSLVQISPVSILTQSSTPLIAVNILVLILYTT